MHYCQCSWLTHTNHCAGSGQRLGDFMIDFNSLERSWEDLKWRLYEADCNIPEHVPTLMERRQALMRLVGKSRGWSDLDIDNAIQEIASGNSFIGAAGYGINQLPPAARDYEKTASGHGVWNLTHRRDN